MRVSALILSLVALAVSATASYICDSIAYKSDQDGKTWYPQLSQVIWPDVRNNGAETIDVLVVESPELAQFNVSIAEVYAYCPGTTAGSPRIKCLWEKVPPKFYGWSKITLQLAANTTTDRKISFPLTLTVLAKNPDTGELTERCKKIVKQEWTIKNAPSYTQTDASAFPHPRSFTVAALPHGLDERERLRQWVPWCDFHPTGFYLNPNEDAVVSVSGSIQPESDLKVLIGTPGLVNAESDSDMIPFDLEPTPLKEGTNVVRNVYGGIIYVQYRTKNWQNAQPLDITIHNGTAAQPFPFFQDGVTTRKQWVKMLEATKVPYSEKSSKRVIVTGLAAYAKQYPNQEPTDLLNEYAGIIGAQDRISGLNSSSSNPQHRPSPLRPIVVQTSRNVNPHATWYRSAIPLLSYKHMGNLTELRRSWMVWHELGHHRQHANTWSWSAMGEVTVNIYSLAARRRVSHIPSQEIEHGNVKEWEMAKAYLAQEISKKDFDSADFFVRLVMFEQLREVFGDETFHAVHATSRTSPELNKDADKKHYFMTTISRLVNENLGPYFVYWGLKPEERSLQEMGRLPDARGDYTKKPVFGGSF